MYEAKSIYCAFLKALALETPGVELRGSSQIVIE